MVDRRGKRQKHGCKGLITSSKKENLQGEVAKRSWGYDGFEVGRVLKLCQ